MGAHSESGLTTAATTHFPSALQRSGLEPLVTNAARRTDDRKLRKAAVQSIVIVVEKMPSRTEIAGNISRLVTLA